MVAGTSCRGSSCTRCQRRPPRLCAGACQDLWLLLHQARVPTMRMSRCCTLCWVSTTRAGRPKDARLQGPFHGFARPFVASLWILRTDRLALSLPILWYSSAWSLRCHRRCGSAVIDIGIAAQLEKTSSARGASRALEALIARRHDPEEPAQQRGPRDDSRGPLCAEPI